MSATATMYYYALQKFEADVFAEDEIEVADKACEDALGNALLADKADKDPFYDFWQSATLLKAKGTDRKTTSHGLNALWRDNVRDFGQQYRSLLVTLSSRLRG
jgi:hypothetical protein